MTHGPHHVPFHSTCLYGTILGGSLTILQILQHLPCYFVCAHSKFSFFSHWHRWYLFHIIFLIHWCVTSLLATFFISTQLFIILFLVTFWRLFCFYFLIQPAVTACCSKSFFLYSLPQSCIPGLSTFVEHYALIWYSCFSLHSELFIVIVL